jgi:hypothetical protein
MSAKPDRPKWAMIASNTRDVFRAAMGETIAGMLFYALPAGSPELQVGNVTLVFASGWGITISSGGAYWVESPDQITRAVDIQRRQLDDAEREIRDLLALAGALDRLDAAAPESEKVIGASVP